MKKRHTDLGFTLVELLVAAVIGLVTTMVGGKVMLDQLESTRKIENQQRQRDDWTRSNTFITSEINLAEEISETLQPGENDHCNGNVDNNNAKMIIRFPRDQQLKPAIYYTVQEQSGWNNNILKRCGPEIDNNGKYLKSVSTGDVIIDGLSNLATGFDVEVTGQKLAKVEINLVGLLNNAYSQQDGSRARRERSKAALLGAKRMTSARLSSSSSARLNGRTPASSTTSTAATTAAAVQAEAVRDTSACGCTTLLSLTGTNNHCSPWPSCSYVSQFRRDSSASGSTLLFSSLAAFHWRVRA